MRGNIASNTTVVVWFLLGYHRLDRDPLLDRVDAWAVHRSYERLLGFDGRPTSAVIFGERGSGKSALRRSVARGLATGGYSLAVEVTDVDPWLEVFQAQEGRFKDSPGKAPGFSDLRLADLIEAHADELALLDSLDMGKPITEALTVDVPVACARCSSSIPTVEASVYLLAAPPWRSPIGSRGSSFRSMRSAAGLNEMMTT